jgi:tight adherence protein C
VTVLIALIALGLCAVAVGSATYALLLPRATAVARLRDIEGYGYADAAVPGMFGVPGEGPPRSSPVLSLAARIGGIVANRVGNAYVERLRGLLITAALYKAEPKAVLGLQVLAAAVLGGLCIVLGVGGSPGTTLVVAAFAALLAAALPFVLIYGRATRRLDTVDRGLPDLIDMLVVTMEAGLGFGASLNAAAERLRGPVGDEIRLTIQEHQMGISLPEALLNMLKRVDSPNMQSFVRSVTQGDQLGISMGTIMRGLADEMRIKRRQAAEEQAQKAPVKMLFPLIFLMFPALGVVILGPALFDISDKLGGVAGP